MSRAVKTVAGGAVLAVLLTGCGSSPKPVAGSIPPTATVAGHAKIDDPRTKHVHCLRQHGFRVSEVGRTWLQIGVAPSGPRVHFEPTPGAAQELQISGQVQGAEVIGTSLLYPDAATDKALKTVEDCLALGVLG